MDRSSRRRGGVSPHFRGNGDRTESPGKGVAQSWLGVLRWCCLGLLLLVGVVIALQIDMGAAAPVAGEQVVKTEPGAVRKPVRRPALPFSNVAPPPSHVVGSAGVASAALAGGDSARSSEDAAAAGALLGGAGVVVTDAGGAAGGDTTASTEGVKAPGAAVGTGAVTSAPAREVLSAGGASTPAAGETPPVAASPGTDAAEAGGVPHWPWIDAAAGGSAVAPVALPAPHGGRLVDLIVDEATRRGLEADIAEGRIPRSLTLTPRQACDIELLLSGGFSPLTGFLNRADYDRVVAESRLASVDALWPMPITLDLPAAVAQGLGGTGARVALRDEFHNLIAILTVGDVWQPDKMLEAKQVLGTTDPSHPAVDYLLNQAGDTYVGGSLQGIALPLHLDYAEYRLTPAQVRAAISARGWPRTVAFQTRNPMHRAHIELTRLAAVDAQAGVLLNPVVGMTKPGDVDAAVRVRCYLAMIASARYYDPRGIVLSLLPLAMRMAGPREAVWHALIRKNHGATHFIVGRDHAGCKSAAGVDFYGPYDAQTLVRQHAAEIGITVLTYQEVEYVESLGAFLPSDKVPAGSKPLSISGTKFRAMMNRGDPIPEWYSDPAVIAILRSLMPPLHRRGFVLFFTGLSGGGKTTITRGLISRLQSLLPTRRVTVLDGDVVRTHLSKGLGFSIADRNTNVARIGWVAAETARQGGVVIASAIAPFEAGRAGAHRLVEAAGAGWLTIHVATSLATCAVRDVKGLYRSAGTGRIDLTGVSHPWEYPSAPDIYIDTDAVSVHDAVTVIVASLTRAGYIRPDVESPAPAGSGGGAAAVIAASAAATAFLDSAPLSAEERALVAALAAGGSADAAARAPVPALGAAPGSPASSPWLASVMKDAQAPAPGGPAAAVFLASLAGKAAAGGDAAAKLSCRVDWDAMRVAPAVGASAGGGSAAGRRVLAVAAGPSKKSGAAVPGGGGSGVRGSSGSAAKAAQAKSGAPVTTASPGLPAPSSPSPRGGGGALATAGATSPTLLAGASPQLPPLPLSPQPTVDDVVAALTNPGVARAQAAIATHLAASGLCLVQPLPPPESQVQVPQAALIVRTRTAAGAAAGASPTSAVATPALRLYGGLPMSGSPSARALAVAMTQLRDASTGGVMSAPSELLLVLALGPLGSTALRVLGDALPGVPVVGANKERLYFAEAFAAATNSEPPVDAGALSAGAPNALPVPPSIVTLASGSGGPVVPPKGSGGASGQHRLTFVDRYWRSSLPATWGLSPASATAVAWDTWTGLRWAVNSEAPLTAVVSPRLLAYAEHMLRLDPCLRILVVTPGGDADATAMAKTGVTEALRQQQRADTDSAGLPDFVDSWIAAADALAASHTDRVMPLRVKGSDLAADAGAYQAVRAWLGGHPVAVVPPL